jgi:hypothetical protein
MYKGSEATAPLVLEGKIPEKKNEGKCNSPILLLSSPGIVALGAIGYGFYLLALHCGMEEDVAIGSAVGAAASLGAVATGVFCLFNCHMEKAEKAEEAKKAATAEPAV